MSSDEEETLCFDVDLYFEGLFKQNNVGNSRLEWTRPSWIVNPRFIESKVAMYGMPDVLPYKEERYSWNANFVKQALQLAVTLHEYFRKKSTLAIAHTHPTAQWHAKHVPMAYHILSFYPCKTLEYEVYQNKHNISVDCLQGSRRTTGTLFPPPPKQSPLYRAHIDAWSHYFDDGQDDVVYGNEPDERKPGPAFVDLVLKALSK